MVTSIVAGARTSLRRHPLPMQAEFGHSLFVTVAFPRDVLYSLLPPGLELDTHRDWGLAAVAVVESRRMRPDGLPPAFGRNFMLCGYRVFCRYRDPTGRRLRGLHILRSDTDSRVLATAGNLLTHYRYQVSQIHTSIVGSRLDVRVVSADASADLDLSADLRTDQPELPPGSPFRSHREARRYAGPLPFTFDYEPETHSIVVIEGVRKEWLPLPVRVDLRKATYFDGDQFGGVRPLLAGAFHVQGVVYHWRRGRREPLTGSG